MSWWNNPVSVPFGNRNYDVGMGGSHDMDFKVPVDTPITVPPRGTGVISDISSPAWGKQVGIKLDQPFGNVPYWSVLHLDAVNSNLRVGQHVQAGDLLGWSGGENSLSQVPANAPVSSHFTNPSYQSSQPQVGVALMYGPAYGKGPAWNMSNPPDAHPELNPNQLFSGGLGSQNSTYSPLASFNNGQSQGQSQSNQGTTLASFLGLSSLGNVVDGFYRVGFVILGLLLLYMGLKHFIDLPSISLPQQQGQPAPAKKGKEESEEDDEEEEGDKEEEGGEEKESEKGGEEETGEASEASEASEAAEVAAI